MNYLIGGVIVILISLVPEAFIGGYLWEWFVQPVLHVPFPPLWYAVGILMCWSLLTVPFKKSVLENTDEEKAEFLKQLSMYLFCRPAVYFLLGWVIHTMAAGAAPGVSAK